MDALDYAVLTVIVSLYVSGAVLIHMVHRAASQWIDRRFRVRGR